MCLSRVILLGFNMEEKQQIAPRSVQIAPQQGQSRVGPSGQIPSCGGSAGGGLGCDDGCDAPQFESPIPGLWGNGATNGCAGCDKSCGADYECNMKICGQVMDFQIVDLVKV